MDNIEQLENRLWEAADQLRANSKLTSTEYSLPVLGLIFLRHACNRFLIVEQEVKNNLPSRAGVTRPITKADFSQKGALFLRPESQYDYLLDIPSGTDIGQKIIAAMDTIEEDYDSLAGVLPKEYHIFDNELLTRLLKIFNDQALQQANGDLFGRIYEYFLMKFAMAGAQDSGEFFTPISLVQTIVNVIEPNHGTILDPACGSGGMFVQTSHFLEQAGITSQEAVTFYGQEKTSFTIRLAKMNLAVHGLEGKIVEGNTFYEDHHELVNECDFVMANPPFNVDGVDAEKAKGDPRLPFGLPGINKKGAVSNGNYLWISYFYSYLNETGRAGFVMSSQASSAGHGEKEVRRKIVESGDVDVMISIRANFFYTRSVPCELWFFNRNKPETMRDQVLMLDARNIYRKVTRKIYDFSPEQLKNLTAIVWLYRGKTEKYLELIKEYLASINQEAAIIPARLSAFDEKAASLEKLLDIFAAERAADRETDREKLAQFQEAIKELKGAASAYKTDCNKVLTGLQNFQETYGASLPGTNEDQHQAKDVFAPLAAQLKGLTKQVDLQYKLLIHAVEFAEQELEAKTFESWDNRQINRLKKDVDTLRKDAIEQLKLAKYFFKQVDWLQARFPDACLVDVEGLVKLADRAEIAANDWSLTPGRYVGVAPPEEDENFDFEETMKDIHLELAGLNEEAAELARIIQANFEELVI